MSETTPLIKAALNLRVGAGFDVYVTVTLRTVNASCGALQIPTKSGLRKVTGVLLKPQRNSGHEQFRAVSFAR